MTDGRPPQRYTGAPTTPGWWQASDGRWYPPTATPGPMPTVRARPSGNGAAVAALVLGIVGAVFSFMFFLSVLALILGVLAIVFGWLGSRQARVQGVGGGQAIAGLVLGILAVVVGAYMLWTVGTLFRTVSDAIERSAKATVMADPVANRMTIDRCNTTIGRAEASGTLVNTGNETRNFSVTVSFYGPGGQADSIGSAYSVAPGATGTWFVQGPSVTQLSGCAFSPSAASATGPPPTHPADPPR